MTTNLFGKDLKQYDDIDVDAILETLTKEELDELNSELDPDNATLPASDRTKYNIDKAPTGPYDREALLDFIEKKALEDPDWDTKPYVKEIRGKIFKAKEQPKLTEEESGISTEFDEILNNASEEELVDLAAILGFTGMLNQVQYHSAYENKEQICGGFKGLAKYQELKVVPNEPPNDTDVEASRQKLEDDDPDLKDLNINNIKNISEERFEGLFNALKNNTHLKSFTMANTKASDRHVKALVAALEGNKSLETVNVESNFLSGEMIVQLLEAINVNKSVKNFRATNQRQSVLGVKTEMRLARLIEDNDSILTVNIDFDIRNARIRAHEHLQKNSDRQLRQKRVGASEDREPSI
ncbi:tropomodulin-like [Lineus longissimus]|uniref:tropomodulin-like n=1 Tax=Lineus longissimus TaxID=88925 RepID=UPI002B4F8B4C